MPNKIGKYSQLAQDSKMKKLNSPSNNSISSLKQSDKKLVIELTNQSKAESYYSPLARESTEKMFNQERITATPKKHGKNPSSKT